MGKKPGALNLPENPSISFTLNTLCSWAELEAVSAEPSNFYWNKKFVEEEAKKRVEKHWFLVQKEAPFLLSQFGIASIQRGGVMRTSNTFPEASGIASSASSFAAMTLSGVISCAKDPLSFLDYWSAGDPLLRKAIAQLSRKGSGSSCRSFEGPWVLWNENQTQLLESNHMPECAHFVLIVSERRKEVTSSEAHSRVRSSPLWEGRSFRAQRRVQELQKALQLGDWNQVSRLSWTEAWEMHSLFHTCFEPFSYWEPGTIEALQKVSPKKIFEEYPGISLPIVTMDAGAQVHLIVQQRDFAFWKERLFSKEFQRFRILEDGPGKGAEVVEIRQGKLF